MTTGLVFSLAAIAGGTASAALWKNYLAFEPPEDFSLPLPHPKLIESLVERFGWNTNSFLLNYCGYEFFFPFGTPVEGAVAFIRTSRAFVVAGDPLCEPERQWLAFQLFRSWCDRQGKPVFILPASERLAAGAAENRFCRLVVGTQPIFDPAAWAPRGDPGKPVRWAVNAARRIFHLIQRIAAF